MEMISDEMLKYVTGGNPEQLQEYCMDYKNTVEGLVIVNGVVQYPPCPSGKKGTMSLCSDCICNRTNS